ncbi:peptidase T [Pelagibaculum spongiae]|uniref:Peptidase T n=1 Tax=Pelagibaculum spongiae TaxID=2080658 RepID=A0A2V1H3W2_9GAMM|nr:peptidase T [Pelagibaculum spongiae]PVZ70336.1 peptidase T [Pelagibaculum spongiae]
MKQTYLNRFLRYIAIDTRSDESSSTVPSTPGQMVLAQQIASELKAMGLDRVLLDDKGYISACLPANTFNTHNPVPAIGFIAHMDTAPDASGKDVKPQIIENYSGESITLNQALNIQLSPDEFPKLKQYIGKTLITTDGTTLLGADNKAGIAAILCAVEYLQQHSEIIHGDICIGFTPDEEIGRGADHFDVENFAAEWAYTIDGGEQGELECESFNAAKATVTVQGRNVHPGTAKNVMINAATIARQFANQMPADEVPEQTDGHQGFFHLHHMAGNESTATLDYLIRDFDKTSFAQRKTLMLNIADRINTELGEQRVSVEIVDQYANMHEELVKLPHVMDIARDALNNCCVTPIEKPIRGGTDGSRLSFMGLPTPNIFTGGHNFHGIHEYLVVESALKSVEVIVELARLTAEQ